MNTNDFWRWGNSRFLLSTRGLAMANFTAEISQLIYPWKYNRSHELPNQQKWKKNTEFVLSTHFHQTLPVCVLPSFLEGWVVFFFSGSSEEKKNSEKKPPHHHLLVFFPKDLSRGTCWRLKGLPRSRWVTVSRFSRRAGKRNQQWRFFSPNRNDGLEDGIFIYIYTFVFWNGHPFLRVTCSFLKGCVCRFSNGGRRGNLLTPFCGGEVSQGFRNFSSFWDFSPFLKGEDPKKTSQISSQKPTAFWGKNGGHFCPISFVVCKKKFTKKPGSLNEICDLLMAC